MPVHPEVGNDPVVESTPPLISVDARQREWDTRRDHTKAAKVAAAYRLRCGSAACGGRPGRLILSTRYLRPYRWHQKRQMAPHRAPVQSVRKWMPPYAHAARF